MKLSEFFSQINLNIKDLNLLEKSFNSTGIINVSQLYSLTLNDFNKIPGLSKIDAKLMYLHLMKLRKGGKLILNGEQLEEKERNYKYLPLTSSELNKIFTYSNNSIGLRSQTVIELYGEPGVGKTQFCMTMAAICMLPENKYGWDKNIYYLDSEGAFEYSRFLKLAQYWGLNEEVVKNKILCSKIENFDEVEELIDLIGDHIEEKNVGILIIDSIMDPLKQQYPIGGDDLSNLQPRQKHLKRVLDKIKAIAQLNNIICIYTNHVRASFDGEAGDKLIPQGGNVLGHASDIRVKLSKMSKDEIDEIISKMNSEKLKKFKLSGLKLGKATIVDCGFLPALSGNYIIGPMGLSDPNKINKIIDDGFKFVTYREYSVNEKYSKLRLKKLKKISDDLYRNTLQSVIESD